MSYEALLPPVQRKMLALLSDGRPHSREELHSCLSDMVTELSSIQPHISCIRRVIRPHGEEILCELVNRRICYRHVRILVAKKD